MPKRKALVIGINNYGGDGSNDLPSCIDDALATEALLERDYGFTEIRRLFDADATPSNVTQEAEWLFSNVNPEDRVVLFYSGHGYQNLDADIIEEYLVLTEEGQGVLFSDDQFVALTRGIDSNCCTLILDCCHAEGNYKAIAGPNGKLSTGKVKSWKPPVQDTASSLTPIDPREVSAKAFLCGRSPTLKSYTGLDIILPDDFVIIADQTHPSLRSSPKAYVVRGKEIEEEGDLQIDALVLCACSENETASASTSFTKGLSAFTYNLLEAHRLSEAHASTATVFAVARELLKKQRFVQTPVLKAPTAPIDLAERTFLSLMSSGGEAVKIYKPGEDSMGTETKSSIEKVYQARIKQDGSIGATKSLPPSPTSADKPQDKWLNFVLPIAGALLQEGIRALSKVYGPRELPNIVQDNVRSILQSSAVLVRTVRQKAYARGGVGAKDWSQDSDEWMDLHMDVAAGLTIDVMDVLQKPGEVASADQKGWLDTLINVAPRILEQIPNIITAARKDFRNQHLVREGTVRVEGGLNMSEIDWVRNRVQDLLTRDTLEQTINLQRQALQATSQSPEEKRKFWPMIIAAGISAIPSIINAIKKDYDQDRSVAREKESESTSDREYASKL